MAECFCFFCLCNYILAKKEKKNIKIKSWYKKKKIWCVYVFLVLFSKNQKVVQPVYFVTDI